MVLEIDTADNQKVTVSLDGESLTVRSGLGSAQNVLPALVKILKKKKASLEDLTAIKVNPGPGSFTGLKVGVTVANTLGYLLGIPVNGREIKADSIVEPKYE